MNKRKIEWLKLEGTIGKCDTCLFRKPIEEMNFELLPCNQFQCLVKLAQVETKKANVSVRSETKPNEKVEKVENEGRFSYVSLNELSLNDISLLSKSEAEIEEKFVGKCFGEYSVLELLGYERKEIQTGKTKGTPYINIIFKCKCTNCGLIRHVTHAGLLRASDMNLKKCRNCSKRKDIGA